MSEPDCNPTVLSISQQNLPEPNFIPNKILFGLDCITKNLSEPDRILVLTQPYPDKMPSKPTVSQKNPMPEPDCNPTKFNLLFCITKFCLNQL